MVAENQNETGTTNKYNYYLAGSGIGFAAGVGYAFYKKTGFWKGWGIAIVSGIAVGALFRGVGYLKNK